MSFFLALHQEWYWYNCTTLKMFTLCYSIQCTYVCTLLQVVHFLMTLVAFFCMYLSWLCALNTINGYINHVDRSLWPDRYCQSVIRFIVISWWLELAASRPCQINLLFGLTLHLATYLRQYYVWQHSHTSLPHRKYCHQPAQTQMVCCAQMFVHLFFYLQKAPCQRSHWALLNSFIELEENLPPL